MITYVDGSLVDLADSGKFDIIIHGCNCQNTMGSGIAKALRDRWPTVYEADCEAAKVWQMPVARLGNFSTSIVATKAKQPLLIINAYTQLYYGRDGKDYFSYDSFSLILQKIAELDPDKKLRWGFPYIGMSLAGGDENRIIPMIEHFAKKHNVTLVDYDNRDPRTKCKDWGKEDDDKLWDADPDCEGRVEGAIGGGVKCNRCNGWYCL